MKNASKYIKLLLRIEQKSQEGQALNPAFVTNSLKGLKLMITFSKSQFLFLWKKKHTTSLWLR